MTRNGGGDRLNRMLAETREINGGRHGNCVMAHRAIDQEVAALAPEVRGMWRRWRRMIDRCSSAAPIAGAC